MCNNSHDDESQAAQSSPSLVLSASSSWLACKHATAEVNIATTMSRGRVPPKPLDWCLGNKGRFGLWRRTGKTCRDVSNSQFEKPTPSISISNLERFDSSS